MSTWEKINIAKWDWAFIVQFAGICIGVAAIIGGIVWGAYTWSVHDDNAFRHKCAAKDPHAYSVIADSEYDCLIPYHGGIKRIIHDNN